MTAEGSRHSPLAVRFLGACEVTVHGRPLPPPRYRKELWLLALLSLRHDREISRDGLAALFWPDAEASQAQDGRREEDLGGAVVAVADVLFALDQAAGDAAPRQPQRERGTCDPATEDEDHDPPLFMGRATLPRAVRP